jgi:hypothetical protein
VILKSVRVVSFNGNEAAAVDALLDELSSHPPWETVESNSPHLRRPVGDDAWEIEHVPLGAQGNVMAAAALADFVAQTVRRPLSVLVFYGCAGVSSDDLLKSAFIIETTSYVSLGKVTNQGDSNETERATVASKWLTTVKDGDVKPLPDLGLASGIGPGAVELIAKLPCSPAHAVATDKVIDVEVGAASPTDAAGMHVMAQWTYAEALAHAIDQRPDTTVLVDMESYGVARMSEALGVLDRVAIMRISTDTLGNHRDSDDNQRDWLMEGRYVLASLIHAIFTGEAP